MPGNTAAIAAIAFANKKLKTRVRNAVAALQLLYWGGSTPRPPFACAHFDLGYGIAALQAARNS